MLDGTFSHGCGVCNGGGKPRMMGGERHRLPRAFSRLRPCLLQGSMRCSRRSIRFAARLHPGNSVPKDLLGRYLRRSLRSNHFVWFEHGFAKIADYN